MALIFGHWSTWFLHGCSKEILMDTRVLANILYLNWCVSLMLQQFLWSSRILLWHPVVLNHTYLFFKMQTIHWPSRQEKNVQIVDTTCPWVSKVGDGVRKHHFSLVFFFIFWMKLLKNIRLPMILTNDLSFFFLHVLLCCHITNTVFVVWPGQTLLAIFCVCIGCKKSQVWTSVEKSKDSNSRGENRVPGRGVFSCFFGWKMVASVFFHRKPPGCPGWMGWMVSLFCNHTVDGQYPAPVDR